MVVPKPQQYHDPNRCSWRRASFLIGALFLSAFPLWFLSKSSHLSYRRVASTGVQAPEDCHIAAVTGTSLEGTKSLFSSLYSVIQNYSDNSRNLCIFIFSLENEFDARVASLDCALADLPLPHNVQIFVKTINKDAWHPSIFSKNLQARAELNSDYNWFRYYLQPADVGGLKKIIWFDTDMIVQGNFAELYDIEMQGLVAAVGVYYFVPLSHHVCKDNREELDKIPMGTEKISPVDVDGHMNTGIFVFDLEEKAKQGILQEWARLLPIHDKKCLWKIDQTAFTIAIHNMFRQLPEEWNIGELGWLDGLERSVGKEKVQAHVKKCEKAKALHWNGSHKPWDGDEKAGCMSVWTKYDLVTIKKKGHCIQQQA